jgi:hypothetical protein
MNHDVVVAEIMARARLANVLSHYCGRAHLCGGDRGAPDLLCVGPYAAAFIEVKMPGSPNLSPAQVNWKHQLRAAGMLHYVVGPECLDNGQADRILRYLGTRPTSGPPPVDSPARM